MNNKNIPDVIQIPVINAICAFSFTEDGAVPALPSYTTRAYKVIKDIEEKINEVYTQELEQDRYPNHLVLNPRAYYSLMVVTNSMTYNANDGVYRGMAIFINAKQKQLVCFIYPPSTYTER